ncbi:aldehyde oxidoreductase, partial [candidate division MSBL1 archaeon SCGC-AAA259E19]
KYHPFHSQRKLVDYCSENDVLLTAYSPLARGRVVGNHTLGEIGEKYGKTEAQVALKWLTQQENVVAIPKASSNDHRKENLEIFDFELNDQEMEKISRIGD